MVGVVEFGGWQSDINGSRARLQAWLFQRTLCALQVSDVLQETIRDKRP